MSFHDSPELQATVWNQIYDILRACDSSFAPGLSSVDSRTESTDHRKHIPAISRHSNFKVNALFSRHYMKCACGYPSSILALIPCLQIAPASRRNHYAWLSLSSSMKSCRSKMYWKPTAWKTLDFDVGSREKTNAGWPSWGENTRQLGVEGWRGASGNCVFDGKGTEMTNYHQTWR
jgi:hypothetical protein